MVEHYRNLGFHSEVTDPVSETGQCLLVMGRQCSLCKPATCKLLAVPPERCWSCRRLSLRCLLSCAKQQQCSNFHTKSPQLSVAQGFSSAFVAGSY